MTSEDDRMKADQIRSKWTEMKEDDVYAPWEELVAAILNKDITKHVDVTTQSQIGSIKSDKAARNLVSEVDEIGSEKHAEVLLEVLQQEQIVEEKDGEVVLFENVSGQPDNPHSLYNWAAAMQLAGVKIEDQIERARELDEQLQEDLEKITDIGEGDPQEQINRLDQKFRTLGDGDGIPDPETLSPSERQKYNQYQHKLKIAHSQKRLQEQHSIEDGDQTDFDISEEIENFQHLHQAFSEYEKQLRTMIQTNKWRNTNVGAMLDGVIAMIDGISMLDQSIEDMSRDEIENTLDELTDSKDQAYEAVKEITGGEQNERLTEEVESQSKKESEDSLER